MNISSFLPRGLAALFGIGSVMLLSVSQQKPVGRVHGRALLDESGRPLAGVRITLVSENEDDEKNSETLARGVLRLRATTDKDGEWELPHVLVGSYRLSAASRAHGAKERALFVNEDETTEVPLRLQRSQPDLQVSQQAREFLPSESVTLPLHGFVDGAKAPGTDALRVRIFRAKLSDILRDPKAAKALSHVANRYDPVATLPDELLHPRGTKAPLLLETRVVPLKGADIEGFYHERLKIGAPGAGLYLVEVAHGKNTVCAQMSVSDLALIVKRASGQMLAYAVDSDSGAPRAGASIRVFQDGRVLTSARTGRDGIARIKLASGEGGDQLMSLASLGESEATVGQGDGSEESDEEHSGFTVHALTDRPIYRPGGRVSWKAITRRTLDSGVRYGVPVGEPVDFEVRDPSGERVARTIAKTNDFGACSGSFELSGEAPSGSYSMVMTVAGEEHTQDFTVASYRKPEFSATVTPNEKHYSFGDEVEMIVGGAYYFGAPVAGGKVHYTVTHAPDWAALYAGEGEDVDQEDKGAYADDSGEIEVEGDLSLDENGHAVIRFQAQQPAKSEEKNIFSDEPQDQIYSVQLSVKDAANREVEASGQVPVWAGDFRLQTRTEGYFAAPGQRTTVSVAASDFGGKAQANVPVELSAFYRKWNETTDKWTDENAQTVHASTGADGSARFAVTAPRAGVWTLSARSLDSRNRPVVATRTLWIAGEEGGDFDAQRSDLSLLTDKKRYNTGETARVLLNAQGTGGTALVTIEGSRLFRSWLVPLAHKSTAFQVPITADYGPNITLAACTVRGKHFASSEAPLRVEVQQRSIRVAVQADAARYAPGDEIRYTVQTSDYQGHPIAADLSFGVVDEAIYALQEDDPRALQNAFYPRHPNSVQTSYSFEPLYLGDVNKAEPSIEARTKFLDTAFWKSDLRTGEDGRASLSFRLPDNLTTWRATAVAQTQDTAFGCQTGQVVVAKDFFVRIETPRFFTGGDHAQVMALVHNQTAQQQSATVKIEADGLTLSGDETRLVSVAPGGVAQVVWPVETNGAGLGFTNSAHLKLSAWTSPPSGARLTDALEAEVPVRPHGREEIQNFVGHLNSSSSWNQNLSTNPASIPANSRLTVRITPSISDALVGALPSLVGFPYGCTEQTMSRFLPDILVQRTLRLHGASDPQAQKLRALLPKMVRDSVTRLARFQHNGGGWGWWKNDDDDPWMTAYVLYGLSQARAEGYSVSDETMQSGRNAGLKMLAAPSKPLPAWQQPNEQNTRAWMLYCLAQSSPSRAQLAQIRAARTQMATQTLDAQALASLVLLDKQLGLHSQAWSQLESNMHREGDALFFWKGSGREEWSDWNDLTATATGLRALVATHPADERIPSILRWMMAQRRGDDWGNTRDTAWVLGALCDYLNSRPVGAGTSGAMEVSLNGALLDKRAFGIDQPSGEWVVRVPWQKLKSSGNTLRIKRIAGEGEPVFYSVQLRQTIGSDGPLPPLATSIPITVSREYRRVLPRATGSGGYSLSTESTNNRLKQGDRIRVRLTFEVPRDLSYVLIEDPFPAGCETTERGEAGEDSENWDYWWSNTDVRDDRIAFFARHLTKGKHVIEYNLRAQTPGNFGALPTMLQAMYAPEVRAEGSETSVSVE